MWPFVVQETRDPKENQLTLDWGPLLCHMPIPGFELGSQRATSECFTTVVN